MPYWIVRAIPSPAIRDTRRNAMSMPADTPAAVTTGPSSTHRRATGVAPNPPSRFRYIQCVVARRPVSRPAAPSRRAPVHTDAVISAPADAPRRYANRRSSVIARIVATPPPGTISA